MDKEDPSLYEEGEPPRKPPGLRISAACGDPDDDWICCAKCGKKKPRSQYSAPQRCPVCLDCATAPETQPRQATASESEVTCPGCHETFPITAEVWGAIAECSECGCEFFIAAPAGT